MSGTETRDAVASVRAYLRELHDFFGDENPDDRLDTADGSSTSADLRLSDVAAIVAEAERLRGVVEAVQALADEWAVDAKRPAVSQHEQVARDIVARVAADLRAALASVSSSREAGEREAASGGNVMPMRDPYRTPAPVVSGGQADGEGERVLAAAKVLYDDYVSEYSYDPWETCDREPFIRQATDVLAAADASRRVPQADGEGDGRPVGVWDVCPRAFVDECEGLPDSLLVRITEGHLDEGGRHNVVIETVLREPLIEEDA